MWSGLIVQQTPSVVFSARLAQSVEHETLNLGVVGSSPTLGGVLFFFIIYLFIYLFYFFFFIILK